jgi:hypothetical protein
MENLGSDQNVGNQKKDPSNADTLSASDWFLHYYCTADTNYNSETSDLIQNRHFSTGDSTCLESMSAVNEHEDYASRLEMNSGRFPSYNDNDNTASGMNHDDVELEPINIDMIANKESFDIETMKLAVDDYDNANFLKFDETDGKTDNQKPKNSRALKPPPENFLPLIPTKMDVLCGRGSGIYKHPGNAKFLELIELHFPLYDKTSKEEKRSISMKIVEDIEAMGGRFLNQDKDSGEWYEIERNEARQKAAQALRGYRGFKKED